MPDEVQPITIRFPVALVEALRQIATEERRSFNAEVVWLLQRVVDERQASHPKKEGNK